MLPKTFPLTRLALVEGDARIVDDNPTLPDVPQAFSRIVTTGDPFAAQDGLKFPAVTYTHVQLGGVNEAKNHFQGMQRLRKGRFAVVSGAFGTGKRIQAHIFVIRMGSRPAAGPWGSNIVSNAHPPDSDLVVATYGLGKKLWHPGGLSCLGDIMAVPVMNGDAARIVFLHTKNPESMGRFGREIKTTNVKAGAVALTKLLDGHFVCAVWRETDKRPQGRIDFYLSNTTKLRDGFRTPGITWSFSGFPAGEKRDPQYQNINFVTERKTNGQTRLFLIGTENGAATAPASNGPNFADLFAVELSADMFSEGAGGRTPNLHHVDTREFRGLREYCNFDAGGGVYVDGKGMYLYSCYHHRVANELRMSEFRSDPSDVIDSPKDGWIELYEHDRFRGKKLGIYGKTASASIRDYRKIFVGGGDFDDTVSSVRFQLPPGLTYRLYREPGFRANKGKGDFLDLTGTGKVLAIRDLKKKPHEFGDKVSSSRFI